MPINKKIVGLYLKEIRYSTPSMPYCSGSSVIMHRFRDSKELASDQLYQKLVKKELKELKANLNIGIARKFLDYLLPQTINGRAQNGHGGFGNRGKGSSGIVHAFPQSTIESTVIAAGLDPDVIKGGRRKEIDKVWDLTEEMIDLAVSGKNDLYDINPRNLMGTNFHFPLIRPAAWPLGIITVGFMDSEFYRNLSMQHYPTKIGGGPFTVGTGSSYLIDKEELRKCSMDVDIFQFEHSQKAIDYLRNLKVIVKKDGPNVDSDYIRLRSGSGVCDDMAMIMAGKYFGRLNGKESIKERQEKRENGVTAVVSGYLADAIDTHDKYVKDPIEGGLDDALAQFASDEWERQTGDVIVTPEDNTRIIYFGAKKNTYDFNTSSSHRRLSQKCGTITRPTIMSHIAFVKGESPGKFRMGFQGLKSEVFYKIANLRIKEMLKQA
mgnify:CR=1 FL=1|jgi:hypothetical protein